MIIGLCSLQYVLEEGDTKDWLRSTLITVTLAVSLVVLAAFAIRELTCEVPAVNLRLLKDPVFLSGTLISSLMFALLMTTLFLLPLFIQTLLGFSATDVGFALMPRILVMMAAMPIVGRIYNVVPPRFMIGLGVLLVGFAAYLMSHFTLDTSQGGIIIALIFQGTGFACIFVPLQTVTLSTVPRHLLADATGLASVVRQVGGSTGLAIAATLLRRFGAQSRTALVSHVTETNPAATARLHQIAGALEGRGMDVQSARQAALRAIDGAVARQSSLIAFERVFLLAGLVFVFVLPLMAFLKAPKVVEGERQGPALEADMHVEV
jgi:DHA2 family multidrug resistance protein